MDVENLVNEIRAFRINEGLSHYMLAKKSGLAKQALDNMDAPYWNPKLDTLKKLCRTIREMQQANAPF